VIFIYLKIFFVAFDERSNAVGYKRWCLAQNSAGSITLTNDVGELQRCEDSSWCSVHTFSEDSSRFVSALFSFADAVGADGLSADFYQVVHEAFEAGRAWRRPDLPLSNDT